MTSTLPSITVPAAVTAVAAWALKGVAIGIAGGLDQSPLETPVFALGLVAFLVAAASLAWGVTAARPVAIRVLASVLAVVVSLAAIAFANAAVDGAVSSTHWVWSEVSLWIISLALLALVLKVRAASGVLQRV